MAPELRRSAEDYRCSTRTLKRFLDVLKFLEAGYLLLSVNELIDILLSPGDWQASSSLLNLRLLKPVLSMLYVLASIFSFWLPSSAVGLNVF